MTMRADEREVLQRRRVAVDRHLHAVDNPEARRAARAALVERRRQRRGQGRLDDRHGAPRRRPAPGAT